MIHLHTLNFKINASILLTLLIVASCYIVILYPQERKQLDDGLHQVKILLKAISDQRQSSLANDIYTRNQRSLRYLLKQMSELEHMLNITAYDSNGLPLISSNNDYAVREPLWAKRRQIADSQHYLFEESHHANQVVLNCLVSLQVIGEPIGYINMIYSLESLYSNFSRSLIIFAALLLTMMLMIALSLSFALKRLVIWPVQRLEKGMRAVQEGELGEQVENHLNDEIGRITQVFNNLSRQQAEMIERLCEDEEQLRRSEKQLRQFMEAIPVGVAIWNAEGQLHYLNQRAVEILGFAPEAMHISTEMIDIYRARIAGTTQSYPVKKLPIVRALSGEASSVDDIELHQEDRIVPVELWGQPVFDDDNKVVYAVSAFQDISERRQAEKEKQRFMEEIRASEERLRVIAETLPIPLIITSVADGLILYANSPIENIFGLPPEELIEKHHTTDFFEDSGIHETIINQFKQQGYVQHFEARFRNLTTGEIRWVDLFLQSINLRDQSEPVIIAAYYDMTEYKQADAERSRLNEELRALNQAYTRFVPTAFLKQLGRESILDIQLGDQVERHMTILFSDIRGFTTMSENMLPQETFNFINSYLSRMEPIISEHGGFIDKYIGDAIMALFPSGADAALQASIGMLETLRNYNETRGSPQRSNLAIGIGLNTGNLMLGTVGGQNRMDGTVIADAVNLASRVEGLTKVYGIPLLITMETYTQLNNPNDYHIRLIDSVKVKGKSDTITVYEVYDADLPDIMALKDETREDFEIGIMIYENEDYEEARRFFLSVLARNPTDSAAQIYVQRCQRAEQMPRSPIVLIVDNDLEPLKPLIEYLRERDFRVITANDGHSALQIVSQQPPHAALLDIAIPDTDSFSLCQQLKTYPKTTHIPVLFMTRLSDIQERNRCFEAGGMDYISKPCQPQEVISRLNAYISIQHMRYNMSSDTHPSITDA